MNEFASSYPLTWPVAWGREKFPKRSNFGSYKNPVTIRKATLFLLDELRKKGVSDWEVIISTNVELRQDGLPYSNRRAPDDSGASVWWKENDQQYVLALDKYDTVADNLHAIGKTIEAMRSIERWGSGEILSRTFDGLKALPSGGESWRDVLGYHGVDSNEAYNCYVRLRSKAHPDKGGTEAEFDKVKRAWEKAKEEL